MLGLLKKEIPSIHAAAFLIGAAGFLSRILGLFRDRLLASEFGASRTLDVYYASFQIPDFLFTVFLVGAASAAILPTFIGFWQQDKVKARLFIGGLLSVFSLGALIISITVAVFAPFLTRWVAPGFDEDGQALMVLMTRIMMLSPIFLGVSNIFSSVVQANRQFLVFALTSIFYNLGIIFGILVFVPWLGPSGLALGVVLGAFLHMAVQIPAVSKLNFRPVFRHWQKIPGLKNVLVLSLPRVAALSLAQVIIIVLVGLGSKLTPGSVAVFQFSNNLRYLPIGIIGVSYAMAAFSQLTEDAVRKMGTNFYTKLSAVTETILFWLVPIAFFTIILRAHIVRMVLGAGLFNWEDTRLTAAALAIFSLAIIAEGLSPLFLRSFYAIGNTKLPLYISLFTATLVIGSAPFFVAMFTTGRASGHFIANLMKVGDLPNVGVLGLAMAFTLGSVVDAMLLRLALFSEAKKYFGSSYTNGFGVAFAKIIVAAFLASVLGYGTLYLLSPHISLSTFWGVMGQATITFLVSASFYGALMHVMGSQETEDIINLFRRKLLSKEIVPLELDHERESLK